MREQALGAILLVKAVEEADPGGALIASAERIAASREARRREGAADPPHAPGGLSEPAARLLAARAEKLLDGLVARHPFIPGFLSLARGPAAVGWLLVLAAAAAGVALSALDGTRQVNILGFPVIGLALWNIAVMLALLAAWTGAIGKRAAPRRPWAEALARMGSSLFAGLAGRFARVNAPLGEALRRFAIEWQAASRFLWIARAKRLLHLAAAALGIGLIGGLYLRGIGLDYEAGWESTFLNAPKVRAMVSVLYGPASALTGIPIPDARHVESIRWRAGHGGEPAAPWIHLLAATTVIFVVLPRLLLALVATAAIVRASRRMPPPPSLPSYFRRVFGELLGIRRGIAWVVPYAYEPGAPALARLREWLPAVLGQHLVVDFRPAIPYGEEEALLRALEPGEDFGDVVVLLLSLAATPEDENHGAVIAGVRDGLSKGGAGTALLVVIDEGPYSARMATLGTAPNRLAERRQAWEAFVAARAVKPCIVDLATADPPEADVRSAVERMRAAVWQPAAQGA